MADTQENKHLTWRDWRMLRSLWGPDKHRGQDQVMRMLAGMMEDTPVEDLRLVTHTVRIPPQTAGALSAKVAEFKKATGKSIRPVRILLEAARRLHELEGSLPPPPSHDQAEPEETPPPPPPRPKDDFIWDQ